MKNKNMKNGLDQPAGPRRAQIGCWGAWRRLRCGMFEKNEARLEAAFG
jgi:hypothetical protein